MQVGTAKEVEGAVTRGRLPLLQLPTGDQVSTPVIIASGKHPGPTLLLTSNIHGNEVTGILVIHRLIESIDLANFHGKIVCLTSLNPTGLISDVRCPTYLPDKDPNRCWPDFRPKSEKKTKSLNYEKDALASYLERVDATKNISERAYQKLADLFKNVIKPDYHCDLHCWGNQSFPFVFMDRIFYDDTVPNALEESQKLFEKTTEFVHSLGLTVVRECPAWKYIEEKLHRSVSGYTLSGMRIPACTIELGPNSDVLPQYRDAGVDALTNLLIYTTMIREERNENNESKAPQYRKITKVPVIHTDVPYRYLEYPQTPVSGIIDWVKFPGDFFSVGDVLAKVRNLDGEVLATITSEIDGFVVAFWGGIVVDEGASLGIVGVKDNDTPVLVPWSSLEEK
mmetsp:Transcript_11160/g.15402  ORF Transcript_11160/g.15402 Transcript_11160/m.15402 type:complete len:396 (+) Transcript_11160:64-1251(+)